jgi:hypothetical protein
MALNLRDRRSYRADDKEDHSLLRDSDRRKIIEVSIVSEHRLPNVVPLEDSHSTSHADSMTWFTDLPAFSTRRIVGAPTGAETMEEEIEGGASKGSVWG